MRSQNEFNFLLYVVALIAIFMFVAWWNDAKADDWVVVTTNAWHASNHNRGANDTQYNETNWGVGWEHSLNDNTALSLGYYTNSFNMHSNYAGIMWQPLKLYDEHVRFGFFAGNITGYPRTTDWRTSTASGHYEYGVTWNPIVIPTISFLYKNIGINVEVLPVPPISDRAILGFQVKYKFN